MPNRASADKLLQRHVFKAGAHLIGLGAARNSADASEDPHAQIGLGLDWLRHR